MLNSQADVLEPAATVLSLCVWYVVSLYVVCDVVPKVGGKKGYAQQDLVVAS